MPAVNAKRANQLVRASALAYSNSAEAIMASTYFSGSGLINNSVLRWVTNGHDCALVAQTDFGAVVSFRGSVPTDLTEPGAAFAAVKEWLNDADVALIPDNFSIGEVHRGFQRSLEKLWPGLTVALTTAAQEGREIWLTGHGKGGALAVLAAERFVQEQVEVTGVMTFGAPRVGDATFAEVYGISVPDHFRFENRNDLIPHLLPEPDLFETLKSLDHLPAVSDLLSSIDAPLGMYSAAGKLCYLDWNGNLNDKETLALTYERERRLRSAGEELITDHFIDAYAAVMKSTLR